MRTIKVLSVLFFLMSLVLVLLTPSVSSARDACILNYDCGYMGVGCEARGAPIAFVGNNEPENCGASCAFDCWYWCC